MNTAERWQYGPYWSTCIFLALLHAGAFAALFHFSMAAFVCFLFLYFVTGCLGITLGFHRLLTHGAFETHPWVKYYLALFGTLAGEGGVIQWVANHRKHHQFADKLDDPHSPRDGFAWAHVIWTMAYRGPHEEHLEKYAPDLLKDPVLVALDRTFLFWNILFAVILFAFGGLPNLLWGFCFRLVFVMHSTWLVNSAAHKWGYRNHDTDDDSRNNWFVALLTFGEGWHNNHHARRLGLATGRPTKRST
jgi:fatty-acid desaturase